MNIKSYEECFASLGDALRLRLACCLLFWSDGLCVCELVDTLQESQSNVSRHLKVMKGSGLVEERREGRWIYYRLSSRDDEFLEDLRSCLENVCGCDEIKADLSRLKNRLKLRKGGRCVIGIQTEDAQRLIG